MSNKTEASAKQATSPRLGFFQKRRARKRFRELAGVDRLIDMGEWQKAFETRNPLIAKRLFQLVDSDGTGYIDEAEYFDFVACLLDTGSDRRYRLLFAIYDLNGDGGLDDEEIRQILQASLAEQSLKVADDELAELASGFLRYFRRATKRTVDCDEFIAGIQKYRKIDRLFSQFISMWLPASFRARRGKGQLKASLRTRIRTWLSENWQGSLWVAIYLVVNGLLFFNAFRHYAEMGAAPAVQFARGFGACLNLNVALILLPVTRSLWTRLRHLSIGRILPVDTMTQLHRGIGWLIVLFSLLHTLAHSVNYWNNKITWATLFKNSAFLTGVIASAILLLMLWGVANKSGRIRERFSFTHLFYGAFNCTHPVAWPALLDVAASAGTSVCAGWDVPLFLQNTARECAVHRALIRWRDAGAFRQAVALQFLSRGLFAPVHPCHLQMAMASLYHQRLARSRLF